MNLALGMAAGAEASEVAATPPIDRAFRHDAARRIAGAEKQDIEDAIIHRIRIAAMF